MLPRLAHALAAPIAELISEEGSGLALGRRSPASRIQQQLEQIQLVGSRRSARKVLLSEGYAPIRLALRT
jgi:hypothetical protein